MLSPPAITVIVPCFMPVLIVFSKRSVYAVAAELQEKNIKCSIIYGALPYDVKQSEAEKVNKGMTDVVVATDAIGMGLNLPIKRIIFMEIEKFDGKIQRKLYRIFLTIIV